MEIVNILAQAIMYSLPAGLVLLAVRSVLSLQIKKEQSTRELQIRAEVLKQNFPLRMAAYERGVLFLERISPQHIILRQPPANQTAEAYHNELNFAIRSEFEHNIAQQVYMTTHAWAALANAKDKTLALIFNVLQELPPNSNAFSLANGVIEALREEEELPETQQAILVLKEDTNGFFKL